MGLRHVHHILVKTNFCVQNVKKKQKDVKVVTANMKLSSKWLKGIMVVFKKGKVCR